jgi:N-acyl-D-aspartate/D-glutamate deacylase
VIRGGTLIDGTGAPAREADVGIRGVALTMDASAPTYLRSHWVRELAALTPEQAIRRIALDTAQSFGIRERGALCEGRFAQRASGYDATFVNGALFMRGGEHAGALTGRVLRAGAAR